jgi:hypothetical protein
MKKKCQRIVKYYIFIEVNEVSITNLKYLIIFQNIFILYNKINNIKFNFVTVTEEVEDPAVVAARNLKRQQQDKDYRKSGILLHTDIIYRYIIQ